MKTIKYACRGLLKQFIASHYHYVALPLEKIASIDLVSDQQLKLGQLLPIYYRVLYENH